MELKLIEFIKNNPDWEDRLQKEPYFLKIKRDGKYIIFNYNQILSDFSNEIVQEARGIIIREDNLKIVCFPFLKFFNVDEKNAANIDWSTAKVQEKIDGSLIKVWFDDGNWHISTNGIIDAFMCPLSNDIKYSNFGELFLEAIEYHFEGNPNYTYMFELVSPYNKVVIDYPSIKAYHIGTRNNLTGQELDVDIGYDKPKQFKLRTEKEVKDAAMKLPFNNEGYVVVDKNYNRVKIKSPAYVNAHRLVNNHTVNKEKILDLILINEQSEFLSYFPEYKGIFWNIEEKLNNWKIKLKKIETNIDNIKKESPNITNKEFALWNKGFSGDDVSFGFQYFKSQVKNYEEYISNLPTKNILEKIERASLYE